MGNKVVLAGRVAEVLSPIEPRLPLVDLFGGMCSVAGAVSASGRRVWVNDVQRYATLAARCLVASKSLPPRPDVVSRILRDDYRENRRRLRRRFRTMLDQEAQVLASGSVPTYRRAAESWRHAGNDVELAQEAATLRIDPHEAPYRLCTLTFAWAYFGLHQCVELDSIRYAVDQGEQRGRLNGEEAAWCRLALLQVASRAASTPGHFAQFLRGTNSASLDRIIRQRRRAMWEGFLDDLAALAPYGTAAWRAQNDVSESDALGLWDILTEARVHRAVFYADPPYSKEQYSRFYHVLETLERYDYPPAQGMGRYRPDRFSTAFARKKDVSAAVQSMCAAIRARDGVLVLSYPSSGLLTHRLDCDVDMLLSEHFSQVERVLTVPARHSTLGARHRGATREVLEHVWIAH